MAGGLVGMMVRLGGLRSVLLVGSALAMPLALVSARLEAAPVREAWSAPANGVILTREARRVLKDGKEVVSRRSYALNFSRDGSGWRVDGTLVASEVETPPELAALAALERARRDDGLFPLRLDADGMILEQKGPTDTAAAEQARVLVGAAVGRIGMVPSDGAAAQDMIARMSAQARAVGVNWPGDLFRPSWGTHSQVRSMALPDGRVGTITMTTDVQGPSGLTLHKLERDVVTELAGTRRVNREIFTLARNR